MAENEGAPAPDAPVPLTQRQKEEPYWQAVDAATARTEAEKDLDKYLTAALMSPALAEAFPPAESEAIAAAALELAKACIAARDAELKARGLR
jgi:hypothetical protein